MAVNSILTPLQMTAGAGLLQNQGLSVSPEFTAAIAAYDNSSLISPLRQTMILTGNAYPTLFTIGANTCASLGDSVPSGYALSTSPTGWVDTFLPIAEKYLGNGDLSKFAQAEFICQGYADTVNPFINSAVNSQTYLANTFTTTNNMVTGDITAVNAATATWGADLANLGLLIDLGNLDELGTPLALVKQLASVGGFLPMIALAFSAAGVSTQTVINLGKPGPTATDAEQKAMYAAMTQITGDLLAQVLQLLGVKTAGIETMADLLNPVKIFPNSFQTLTVTDVNNVSEKIYIDAAGTVNPTVGQHLPSIARSTLV